MKLRTTIWPTTKTVLLKRRPAPSRYWLRRLRRPDFRSIEVEHIAKVPDSSFPSRATPVPCWMYASLFVTSDRWSTGLPHPQPSSCSAVEVRQACLLPYFFLRVQNRMQTQYSRTSVLVQSASIWSMPHLTKNYGATPHKLSGCSFSDAGLTGRDDASAVVQGSRPWIVTTSLRGA